MKSSSGATDATCPYAVALEETASVTSNNDEVSLEQAIHKCPAFANDAPCPFKDATSQEAVQAKMLTIPPSHYQMTAFTKVLAKLHDAANTNASHFQIPGGCPVPPEIKNKMSFRQAMEDLSLAAVMARMAERMNHDDDDDEEEDESEELSPETMDKISAVTTTNKSMPTSLTEESMVTEKLTLSESLKKGTAASHKAAEDVHFVRNFIRGEIDKGLYAKLVVALYHVYERLETHLDAHGPTQFPTCHFPDELRRTDTLAEDMDFWNGAVDNMPASLATADYVQRLDEIARTNPLLLLAHAYTRYLGDLSGGKVLARVAARALQLDRHTMEGLAFYQFDKIRSAKLFKDKYRQALDDLPLTADQIEGLVAEANVAFCLNMRLFEELDVYANVPGAKVRPLSDALAYANPDLWKEKNNNNGGKEECPFLAQSKEANATTSTATNQKKAGRCPWPFILAHDPIQFLNDWQTWVLVGIILCIVWSRVVQAAPAVSS